MEFLTFDFNQIPASVKVSEFKGEGGTEEFQIVIHPTVYGNTETQIKWIYSAYQNVLNNLNLNINSSVLRRFFCSDLKNQSDILKTFPFANPENSDNDCAVSLISQPSLPPAKISLWAYHIYNRKKDFEKIKDGTSLILKNGELSHIWTTGLTNLNSPTHYEQTKGIFEKYKAFLQSKNMTLKDNLIRTWLFVQNIDAYYKGMVNARKEFFAQNGLTPQTHFVASTGIEGSYTDPAVRITMDAYSIAGVKSPQITFLSALDHLSPTHIYGVTFERGTAVSYCDRKHIFISGTASIDHQGNILYPGDVKRQLDRTLENIEALLKPAGAGLKDMGMVIVYLRDISDFNIINEKIRVTFGDMPIEIVAASVCRPGWLIEIEGQAIIPCLNPSLPAF